MKPKTIKQLKAQFFIKWFMQEAGNDSKKLNNELIQIINQLEKLL